MEREEQTTKQTTKLQLTATIVRQIEKGIGTGDGRKRGLRGRGTGRAGGMKPYSYESEASAESFSPNSQSSLMSNENHPAVIDYEDHVAYSRQLLATSPS